jgi:hypothetical protein
MGTLKTTLKVESSDLFPTPVNFTQVNNNACNGDTQNFSSIVVTNSATQLNITPILAVTSATNLGGAYVYLRSKATNTQVIFIDKANTVTAANAAIALGPGDTAFLRVGNTSGSQLWAIAGAAGSFELEYFIGEK